jgi:putative transposase
MNRNRIHPAVIRYALFLYFSSRSLRLAARCFSSVIKRSHVAIWKWVQRYASFADRLQTCMDRRIFVDETLVRINDHDYWLWIACELYLDVCLSMHLSREKTNLVC